MDKIGADGWAASARGLPNMSLPEMNLQIETKSGRKMEKNTDKARASVSKEPSFMAAVPDGGLNVQIASKPLLSDKR